MTKETSNVDRKWWRRIITLSIIGLATLAFFYKSISSRYWKKEGQSGLMNSNLEESFEAFQRAAQIDESDPETQFLLARVCRRMGKFEEMEAYLSTSLELGASAARVRKERILANAQVGRIQHPGKTLSELLLSAQGDEREICRAFVNGLCLNLQFVEALQVLEAWHADYPQDAEPWFRRGIIQSSLKQWAKAEEAFREGLRLQPDQSDMRIHLADCLFEQQQHQEAHDQFKLALEASPNQVDAMFGLARSLMKLGERKKSRILLEDVVRRDANHEQARRSLARLELESNNPSGAIEWLSPYLEEENLLPETAHLLAQTFSKSGNSELAEKYGRKYTEAQSSLNRLEELFDNIEEVQQDVDLRYEVGVLTYRYHSRKEGLGWVRSVLLADPNHHEAREFLKNHDFLDTHKIGPAIHE